MKELAEKSGVLVELDLPWVGEGTEAEVQSHLGSIVWIIEYTFKAESETADLWKAGCNENQRVLAAAVHTLYKDICPLKGTVAGSCSLGILWQFMGRAAVYWGDMERGGV